MTGVFEALGDATRRSIVELLVAGERPAGSIVTALQDRGQISQSAVSQHLRVLRETELVVVRAQGAQRFYALDPVGLAVVHQWVERLADPLAVFTQPLDALTTEVARGRRSRSGQARKQAGQAA